VRFERLERVERAARDIPPTINGTETFLHMSLSSFNFFMSTDAVLTTTYCKSEEKGEGKTKKQKKIPERIE
jgi:hypothetical protein